MIGFIDNQWQAYGIDPQRVSDDCVYLLVASCNALGIISKLFF